MTDLILPAKDNYSWVAENLFRDHFNPSEFTPDAKNRVLESIKEAVRISATIPDRVERNAKISLMLYVARERYKN